MITTQHLTKHYGARVVVDDVSLTCHPGDVTGFLGPNGAGKSTTLRMLCGLTQPTSGSATIGGRPFTAIPNPGRHVGVLLDASAQHAGRTGRETLTLAAQLMGVARRRVGEVLELVGLTSAEARARTRTYSLGMRQRLGIGLALLGEPDVLLLDEPANGLDPTGMLWMRDLLRAFAADGGTVLLSSHMLREMEAVCNQLIIIGGGRILAQGSTTDLLTASTTRVSSDDDARLAAALDDAGHSTQPCDGPGLLTSASSAETSRVAAQHGIGLIVLEAGSTSALEDLFFTTTAPHSRQEISA